MSIVEPEKLEGRIPAHPLAFVGGERALSVDDVAWRRGAHVEGEIAAQHHALGADGVEEQAERPGRVREAVEVQATKVVTRRSIDEAPALGPDGVSVVEPARDVGKES